MSPNGRDIALARTVEGNSDIWLLDIERGGLSRMTSAQSFESAPVWSPRGDRIVFSSSKTGTLDAASVYSKLSFPVPSSPRVSHNGYGPF